ncbi:MAG TPA: hypothetical protein VF121_14415 [Thermoanaerobaculia bacterium]|nr:hypothetical protein [Thermoanaerobaculia bacterium]
MAASQRETPLRGTAGRPPTLYAAVLFAACFALALLLYFPTLGNSWAYDDIDYINQAGDLFAGEQGLWATLFRPQGEHIVAGFRLALLLSLRLFGIAALPFRLAVLTAHAASGLFLGLVARRYARSWIAAAAAAILYVGACGLSSMWIWFPSGSSVPFAMALLTGAAAAVAYRDRLGARCARLVASVAVVAAVLTESTLAPVAALPMMIDEYERRQGAARRWSVGAFSVFCLVAAAAASLLASTLYTSTFGPRVTVSLRHGAPRAVFLLLSAPFRLFFPGVSVLASEPGGRTAVLASLLGIALAAPASALLLWRRGMPRLVVVAALSALGPLGWVALVGLGRFRTSYWELYEADRYYFPLLIPLALLAGAVAASLAQRLVVWPRRTRAALAVLLLIALGAQLALHRRAMLRRIPFDVYAAHERRFAHLARLADRLEGAARALPPGAPPLRFPDGDFFFSDVHNGRISARVLLHVLSDGAGGRLRLGAAEVGPRDERLLDPLLAAWAREIREPLPYLSIENGRLADAHVVRLADFRAGPQKGTVVSGFYAWEGTSRWMGRRGELRLTLTSPSLIFLLAAPIEELRKADPRLAAIRVQVIAVDEGSGWAAPLGTLTVDRSDLQLHRLDATPFLSRLGNGRIVHLVLASDRTWRPSEALPGSGDTRELSVMVFAAGCEQRLE